MKPAPTLVLVVEDDFEIREALCEFLREEGYEVVSAAHGQEALEYLRSHAPPSLVLLDLMMPVMNGWQLMAAMQGDPDLASVPVVLLSALGARELENIPGAVERINKPVRGERLLETLRRIGGDRTNRLSA